MKSSSNLEWYRSEFACGVSSLLDDTIAVIIFDRHGVHFAPVAGMYMRSDTYDILGHVHELGEFFTWEDLETVRKSLTSGIPENPTAEPEAPTKLKSRIIIDE